MKWKEKSPPKNSDVVMHIDRSNPDGYHSCNDAINDWYQLCIQAYQLTF